MPSLVLHIQNEEPIIGETDKLPGVTDTMIFIRNARRRDGKEIPYIDPDATMVIFAMTRIHFIEILEDADSEEIISHVRE